MQERTAPQVSIVVPVYNVEGYLRRCLNSILAQTLKEWECICVDDGSTDACGAILDEYAAKDSRFVVIHQENGGVSVARNAGLDAACAEYIGFVDPDDWIESDTYELALDAARRTDADIVQWGSVLEREDGATPSKECGEGFCDIARDYKEYFVFTVWCKLFRRSFLFKNSLRFLVGVRRGEDTIFSLIAYAFAQKCFYLNLRLYHYDLTRESSVCHNTTADIVLERAAGLEKAFEFIKQRRPDWYARGGGLLIT